MLFVAFCKVKPTDLKPRRWHLWLILTQVGLFTLSSTLLWLYPNTSARLVLEGFMLAIICPTATACAVVTQKLGGDSATTTAYTILINLVVAVMAPLLLPFAHPQEGVSFLPAFLIIIKKVFPLLMLPLLLAWLLRYLFPRLVGTLVEVGRHRITLQDFRNIIEGKKRTQAGESMPAHALFL